MFKTIFSGLVGVSLLSQLHGGLTQDPGIQEIKVDRHYIKRVFEDVIEDIHADETVISQYFSPLYMQYADGHVLNYDEFIQHMLVQKRLLETVKVTIERCIVEKNKICTIHRVDAVKKNGNSLAVRVIAYFEVEEGKITLCDELTYLLKGEGADKNIGTIK